MRGMLQQLGADGMMDYGEVDVDGTNLPYDLATHNSIADEDGGDHLDPDLERRDAQVRREVGADVATAAAERAALLEVAAEMARHSDANAKRRRVDSQKDKECEDLRQKCEDLQQKNEDLQQRLDASERRCLELEEKRSGCAA